MNQAVEEEPRVDFMPRVPAQTFIRRLHVLYPLLSEEIAELVWLVEDVGVLPGNHDILVEQQSVGHAFVLLEGLACSYRTLNAGQRQMTGFIVPGDFCDHSFLSSSPIKQSILSLGRVRIGRINLSRLSALGERRPNIIVAIMRAAAIDRACSAELAISLGVRDAIERVGHFLCEMHQRLNAVGLVESDGSFLLAMTQSDLGDALGLSTVHINRTIQQLRRDNLISMPKGSITILDLPALSELAGFDARYLRSS